MSVPRSAWRIESRYRGRTIVVPTLHGKGAAISRALGPLLGVGVLELTVDTDRFGTFSGTVPRHGGAMGALAAKVDAARERCGEDCLVVASEGSYGPHPAIPWLMLGTEWLRFSDPSRGDLDVHRSTVRPLLRCRSVRALGELDDALAALGFPAHGVMLRGVGSDAPAVTGLVDPREVRARVASLLRGGYEVELTNDLRAHLHPRRMRMIERTAWALGVRLRTGCPSCGRPGFGEPRTRSGLPCAGCGIETPLVRARLLGCGFCGHAEERPIVGTANPAFCSLCNP